MKEKIALLLILLLGFSLRIYGIDWGLPNEYHPYSYHPDEPGILYAISNMNPASLDFNPKWFVYPTLYIYSVAGAIGVSALTGWVKVSQSVGFYLENPAEFAKLYLVGRFVTLLFAILSIFLIYKLGERMFSRRVGLLSAALLAIVPLHVINSHYMTVDIALTFWILLTLWFSLDVCQSSKNYLLAAASAGFAASTKWHGAIAFLILVTAHLIREKPSSINAFFRIKNLKPLLISSLAFVAAFLIGTPYSVTPLFASEMMRILKTAAVSTQLGADLNYAGLQWPYLYQLAAAFPFILGIPMYIASIFGAWDLRKKYLLNVFPLVYFLFIGSLRIVFPRYYLPLVPFFCLYAAHGLTRIRKKHQNAIIVLVLLYTFIFSGSQVLKFRDTVDDSTLWVYENIPENSTVVTTLFAPLRYTPFFETAFSSVNITQIKERRENKLERDDWIITNLKGKKYKVATMMTPRKDWIEKYAPQYVIISSMEYLNYQRVPVETEEKAVYDWIRNGTEYKLIKVFDRKYINEDVYTKLDIAFKSTYQSPRIEIYKKIA